MLLGSCFEFEQSVELQRNGSGEFELVVRVPDMDGADPDDGFMSEEEANAQAEASGVEILENSVARANGKVTSKIRIAFDNVDELNAFMQKPGEEGSDAPNFVFSLEKNGGESTFTHKVIPAQKAGAADADTQMGELMLANMLKDSYYSIRWILPGEVLRASDGATIEGSEVSFKVPMVALMNGSGVDVSATYESGLAAWSLYLIGGAVLVGLIVVLPRLRKKS